jgi:ubiquinone/menaquinone biosynthesis C-methylase UbiE
LHPGLPEDAKILDIGCGLGMQTIPIARLCSRCSLVAVDVHQPFLNELMRRAATAGNAVRISPPCASTDDLPY